jgi:hypothetical protein
VVVTDTMFLVLEPDSKLKGVVRLLSLATLPTLEQIKRNFDHPDAVTFVWRQIDEREPWSLNVIMQNASECVNIICKHLK